MIWNETKEEKKQRLSLWQHSRFGMFIHWGIYALAARHEWVKNYEEITTSDYQKYFDHFDPDLYSPKEWAKAAKNAGMKYFVITTKHHDGFCLWNTKYTNYKVTNTPHGKDLIKPMVDAFRAEGLSVGFYYSLLDWHHPHFTVDRNHPQRNNQEEIAPNEKRDMKIYQQYMRDQITELLTDFGTIDLLWLDYSYPKGENGKGHKDWDSEKLLELVRRLQPKIILNDRLDILNNSSGWDFRSPEQFKPQKWPEVNGEKVPWETCQTFSGSWGYYRDETSWKSVRQLLVLLIETVSKGGNLLLNIGPTARGKFDVRALKRLEGIGNWMQQNARSIYGCTQAPEKFIRPDNCILTYNKNLNRLYIHLLDWPMGKLVLSGYDGKIEYAQLLHDASEVQWQKNYGGPLVQEEMAENSLVLNLPMIKPNVEIPVVELWLK